FTQFVLPTTATIAAVFQQQRPIAYALLALAFLSLGISLAPAVTRRFEKSKLDRKEQRAVTAALENLNRHISKFEQLVSTRNADTLHYFVVNSLCQNNAANYTGLFSAPATIFSDLEEQLISRMNERKPSFKALRDSVWEFNFIVSGFSRYFACPIYEN